MGSICKEKVGGGGQLGYIFFGVITCDRLRREAKLGRSGACSPHPENVLKNEGHCGCLRTLFSVVQYHVH